LSTGSVGLPKSAWQQSMPSDVNTMEIPNDFKELLGLFSVNTVRRPFRESPRDSKHKVEYFIAGLIISQRMTGSRGDEIL
jgi:hypothetical protein